jgi:hypothetical protein
MRMVYKILYTLILLFFSSSAHAAVIVSHDFNDMTWGGLSAQSLWSLQSAGGINNSPAARISITGGGDAYKSLYVPIDAYNSAEYWVEADIKVVGGATGGVKLIKFFGRSDSDPSGQRNNMTFGMDGYKEGIQQEVAYFGDTVCNARWNGYLKGTNDACYIPVAEHTTSEIDLRGGTWGRYKLWVKRADSGTTNGQVKVWFNGVLRAHWTNMASNPSPYSSEFNKMSFGGYVHSTYESPWELWLDNIYVGTTEKDGTSPELTTCYPDFDGDLYPGSGGQSFETCPTNYYALDHFNSLTLDCDDTLETGAAINPGATEICDSVDDENCDGIYAVCGEAFAGGPFWLYKNETGDMYVPSAE